MQPKIIRIDTTDVILQDYDEGQGKIIISDNVSGINLSYYWGAMGSDLSSFIQRCSDDYLIRTIGVMGEGDINIKKTMANVRSFIKTDCLWEFYMDIEANKELVAELNRIQKNSYCAHSFVSNMENLNVIYYIKNKTYKYYFEDTISMLKSEPWHFIVYKPHPTNAWLAKFIVKLKEKLSKGVLHEA